MINTIKKIFLPEKIGTKRILSQRILGLDYDEENVHAVLVYAKRSGTTVEKLFHEKIKKNEGATQDEATTQSFKKIIQQVKRYDQIRVAIPSGIVIFKELEIPFTDSEKIRMVLEYEIEPMLPFDIDEAIIDFIITKQSQEEGSSQILVAAVRNSDLANILDLYTNAGIEPNHITIDLFALYGLYQQIPEYKGIEGAHALVHLNFHSLEISFIENGQLRLRRFMPRGIKSIAQEVSQECGVSIEKVLNDFKNFGFKAVENDEYGKSIQKHVIDFFNDVQFTLNSFSLKLNYYKGVQKIFIAGSSLNINNFIKYTTDLLQIPCEVFAPEKLFADKTVKNKVKKEPEHWDAYAMALGTAMPSLEQTSFDLRRKMFTLPRHELIAKQLVAACITVLFMLTVLGTTGYFQISNLKAKTLQLEKREINKLLGMIPRKERPKKPRLQTLVAKASRMVKENAEIWASFEKEELKPLEFMLELTTIMDKKLFNIDVEEISIAEQPVTARERGLPPLIIEINGFFKSKRGTGFHFTEFKDLVKRFDESALVVLAEPVTERFAEEKGVQFTIRLKKKEEKNE